MKKFSLLVLLCLFGLIRADETDCPENCVYKKCADPCPKTCDNLNAEITCTRKKCTPGCQCKDGYVLHEGNCIPIMECPAYKCGTNAVYAENPCSRSCAHMFTHNECQEDEEPGCQCLEGYFKNTKGECVSNSECTVEEVICPSHSSFSTCASSCPATCVNQFLDLPCDRMCNIRCQCDLGYVLNEYNECVPSETCDPEKVICPRSGQTFHSCGYQRTCDNMYAIFLHRCAPGCYCDTEEVWNESIGECVPMGECENSVENKACRRFSENMQYYSKHPVEMATCKNPEPLISGHTDSGCYCKEGYVLNSKNDCVLLEQCCTCRDFN